MKPDLFIGTARACSLEQRRQRRPTTARVDNKIGIERVARFGDDTGDVRYALGSGCTRLQCLDRDAAANLNVGETLSGARQRRLTNRTARGERGELIVAVTKATCEFGRDHLEGVEANGADLLELARDFRKLRLRQAAKPRQEHVNHAELIHPPPFPVLPRVGGIFR
jgi:hypothetical protein